MQQPIAAEDRSRVLTITLSTPFFHPVRCVREVPAIRSTAGLPTSSSPRWTDADDVAPFRRAAQLPWKLRSDGVAMLRCHWLERGGAPAVGPPVGVATDERGSRTVKADALHQREGFRFAGTYSDFVYCNFTIYTISSFKTLKSHLFPLTPFKIDLFSLSLLKLL